ncbi:MAG: hypothetical protein RJB38_2387 [Pseudomonadota bacterium]|jgi:hypothetical protein
MTPSPEEESIKLKLSTDNGITALMVGKYA